MCSKFQQDRVALIDNDSAWVSQVQVEVRLARPAWALSEPVGV